MKDIALLDKMYEVNLTYYKELAMYVLAGKQKLAETRNGELQELKNKAMASGLARMHRQQKIWIPDVNVLRKSCMIWN